MAKDKGTSSPARPPAQAAPQVAHGGDHHRDEAYSLSTPDQHRRYYDEWADTYDDDFVAAEGYAAPHHLSGIFARVMTPDDLPVADIGCGTGLVGQCLRNHGIDGAVHGFDISPKMMEIAAAKGGYDKFVEADITAPLPRDWGGYGALLSAGTFTLGHLGPDDLARCFPLLRPGGLALISINAVHFRDRGFDEAFQDWQNRGMISAPVWHNIDLYFNPEDVVAGSKTGIVAEFRVNPQP
ncbi:MAG: methyltransferase domain-containing protein [Alphaproteobacteria bacterium]|nr:methyltransferase domain-containing protein [Alphaproteobacteria bacterium]